MVESIQKTIEMCKEFEYCDNAKIDNILITESEDWKQYYKLNEYFCYLVDLSIPDWFKDNELFLNKMHDRVEKELNKLEA